VEVKKKMARITSERARLEAAAERDAAAAAQAQDEAHKATTMKAESDLRLKTEQYRVSELEVINADLVAEKTVLQQRMLELEAHINQSKDVGAKRLNELAITYKKAEEVSKRAVEGLQKQVDDYKSQVQALKTDALAGKTREAAAAKQLKAVTDEKHRVETLAQERLKQLETARRAPAAPAATPAKPKGTPVTHVERQSFHRIQSENGKLKLRAEAADRERAEMLINVETYRKRMGTLQETVKKHEEMIKTVQQSLKEKGDQATAASSEVKAATTRLGEATTELEALRKTKAELEETIRTQANQIAEHTAVQEGKLEKMRAAEESAQGDAQEREQLLQKWQNKYREQVQEHAEAVRESDEIRDKMRVAADQLKDARRKLEEAEAKAKQAEDRAQQESEAREYAKKQQEQYCKDLQEENKRYQEAFEKKVADTAEAETTATSGSVQRPVVSAMVLDRLKAERSLLQTQHSDLKLEHSRTLKEVKALRLEAASLRESLGSGDEDREKLQRELRKRDKEIQGVQRLQEVEAELQALTQQSNDTQRKLDQATKDLTTLRTTHNSVLQKLRESEEAKKQAIQQVKEKEEVASSWEGRHAEVLQRYKTVDPDEFNNKLKQTVAAQTKLAQEKQRVEENLAQVTKDCQSRNAELAKLRSEMARERSEAAKERTEWNKQKEEFVKKLEGVQAQVQQAQEVSLRKELDRLKGEIQQKDKELEKHQIKADQLDAGMIQLRQKNAQLETEKRQMRDDAKKPAPTDEVKQLRTEKTQAEAELAKVQAQLTRASSSTFDQETRLAEAEAGKVLAEERASKALALAKDFQVVLQEQSEPEAKRRRLTPATPANPAKAPTPTGVPQSKPVQVIEAVDLNPDSPSAEAEEVEDNTADPASSAAAAGGREDAPSASSATPAQP